MSLFVAFLFGGPMAALVVGRVSYDSGVGHERTQRLTRHRVTATVEKVTEVSVPGSSLSTLRWRTPAGETRIQTTGKAKGDRAGRRRQIWTDQSGTLTGHPQSHVQTIVTAAIFAAGALTAAGIALYGIFTVISRRLDQVGAALWDAEWREIAPHWTGRT
jgi:hypothetical protein